MLNQFELREKYAPLVEKVTGLSYGVHDRINQRIDFLTKYIHNHQINETPKKNMLFEAADMVSESAATFGNTLGMGNVTFPGSPVGLTRGASGSGDRPSSLSLALQIAAQTVGFDLLPSITMDTPLIMHHFIDFPYTNGTLSGAGNDKVAVFQLKGLINKTTVTAALTPGQQYFIRNNAGTTQLTVQYLFKSRINGNPVFKLLSTAGNVSVNDAINAVGATGSIGTATTPSTQVVALTTSSTSPLEADYINANEDDFTAYLGQGWEATNPADFAKNANKPYGRAAGESTPARTMGVKFSSQSIEAGTLNVDIAMTREQVHDARQFGFDLIGQAKVQLANQTTQAMNKHILDTIFELGAKNHKNIYDVEGENFNINISQTGAQSYNLGFGIQLNGISNPAAKSATGGETLGTAQRRILDMLLYAANSIDYRGRYGAADTAVMNTQLGTLLQTIRGFQPYPMVNKINQVAGQLRPLGEIAGIMCYVDPTMRLNDTRVAVFRRGDGATPGACMFPYVIGDTVEIIAEGTMGPKIQLKSRYALDTIGHHPETNYITFKVGADTDSIGALLR